VVYFLHYAVIYVSVILLNVGSSATRGSHVYVGINLSSGELVAVSDWLIPSSARHGTQQDCQAECTDDCRSQVLSVVLQLYCTVGLLVEDLKCCSNI